MSEELYLSIGGQSKKTAEWYCSLGGLSKKVIAAYCSVGGLSERFYSTEKGYVIFDNGEWHHVPQGFNLTQNYAETNGKISDLTNDYLTDKLLWVHDSAILSQWIVDNDDLLDSQMNDYQNQICKNEIYIPIDRISHPNKLKVTAKGNVVFSVYAVGTNRVMAKMSDDKAICGTDMTLKIVDISGGEFCDYIKISAPDEYEATNEDVTNPYVYQPIPFLIQTHLYTNDSRAYNLPGMEVNQISGGDMYCFRKYREPDDSNQCLYMMSTASFSVEVTYRFYNQPTYETWVAKQIQANPPVYAIIKEGYWWGYKFQNVAIWKTNYHGGWNRYYDIDVGNIVLYGDLNILPTPTGVQNSLQLIKRIEITGGEDARLIPQMTSNTTPEGSCTAGDGIPSNTAYYAFDRDNETFVGASSENVFGYVEYTFAELVNINRVMVTARQLSMTGTYTFTLKVSLYVGDSWSDLGTFAIDNQGMQGTWKIYTLDASATFIGVAKIRVETLNQKIWGESYHIAEIQAV